MTTVAPIDLEREKLDCLALIDLENIRLSWQRTYGKVFEYSDLVLLCGLTERLMDTPVTRMILFATDPKQFHAQQVKVLAFREKLIPQSLQQLDPGEVAVLEHNLNQRGVQVPTDVQAGYRLIANIQADVAAANIKPPRPVPVVVCDVMDESDDDDACVEVSMSSDMDCFEKISDAENSDDDCELLPPPKVCIGVCQKLCKTMRMFLCTYVFLNIIAFRFWCVDL